VYTYLGLAILGLSVGFPCFLAANANSMEKAATLLLTGSVTFSYMLFGFCKFHAKYESQSSKNNNGSTLKLLMYLMLYPPYATHKKLQKK